MWIPKNDALIGHKDIEGTNFFRRTNGLIAGDSGFSIGLSDKRVLWLFGDSYIDDMGSDGTVPCHFEARNAAILQSAHDWSQNATKTLIGNNTNGFESLFKTEEDSKSWFWPEHGVQIKDTVYVYCPEFVATGSGSFDFESTGNDSWCKMKFPDMTVSGYTRFQYLNGIDFGAGFVYEKDTNDKHVYAYGQKPNGQLLGRSLYVSRFLKDKPEEAFEFWDGKDWVKDVLKAHPLLDDEGDTMSVNKVKDKYVVLSTEFSIQCDQGKTIYARIGDHITGPFTKKMPIYTLEDIKYQNHYPFYYMAISHPELINDKNELLITYSINNYEPCIEGCPKGRLNPDHYRLQAIRVPIDLLFKLE